MTGVRDFDHFWVEGPAGHTETKKSYYPLAVNGTLMEEMTSLEISCPSCTIQSAKGLAHLHEDCCLKIIHCDIEADSWPDFLLIKGSLPSHWFSCQLRGFCAIFGGFSSSTRRVLSMVRTPFNNGAPAVKLEGFSDASEANE